MFVIEGVLLLEGIQYVEHHNNTCNNVDSVSSKAFGPFGLDPFIICLIYTSSALHGKLIFHQLQKETIITKYSRVSVWHAPHAKRVYL